MYKFGRKERVTDDFEFDHSGYVDIHCHILPGIDDGPATIDESVALAEEAVANGLTDIVATPHLNLDLFPFSLSACQKAQRDLRETLINENIPLEIHLGAEVKADPTIVEGLRANEVPTLAGGKYVLIEIPFEIIPAFTRELVFKIQLLDLVPILAHPERNIRIQDNPDLLRPFIDSGCWTQINSTSITGYLGKASQDCAFELLAKEWVNVIASDSHEVGNRGPNFKNAVALAAKYTGVREAQKLVRGNPAKVIE